MSKNTGTWPVYLWRSGVELKSMWRRLVTWTSAAASNQSSAFAQEITLKCLRDFQK
jgi:hypothetical protein